MLKCALLFLVFIIHYVFSGHVISSCLPEYRLRPASITYVRGNSSLIIVVPNSGTVYAKLPIRSDGCWQNGLCDWNPGCQNESSVLCPIRKRNDKLTRELAILTANTISRMTGNRPHIIINRYHVIHLDVSVDKIEGTAADSVAGQFWEQFHCYIDFVETLSNTSLIIELHESQNPRDNLMTFGYLLGTENWHFDNDNRVNSSLLLATRYNSLMDAVLGPHSLGSAMQNAGYDAVPSYRHVCPPGKIKYTSGSYITKTHGSSRQTAVDAVYVSAPSAFMRMGRMNTFSHDFASAIIQFWNRFYEREREDHRNDGVEDIGNSTVGYDDST